jgi:glutaredoxin
MTPPTTSHRATVTVYGADWCEDTHRSRRLLRRLGVVHAYRNVDDDLEALGRATELGHGVRRTPVVEIDGESVVEPSNEALMAVLVSARVLTEEEAVDRSGLQNVGDLERLLRAGGGVLLYAATRRLPPGLRGPLGLLGAALMLTGIAGWCPVYNARRVSSLGGPGDRPGEAERTAWLRPTASVPE